MKYIKNFDKNGEEFLLPIPEDKDELDQAIEFLVDRPDEKLRAIPDDLMEEWRKNYLRVKYKGWNQVEIIKDILKPVVISDTVIPREKLEVSIFTDDEKKITTQ